MPLMWRKDKHDGRGRIKICFIIFNDYVTNLVPSTAVREDSSAFCFPSYGHGKRKIPRQAEYLPWEMKGRLLRLTGFKPLPRHYRRGSDRRHRLQWWSRQASRHL